MLGTFVLVAESYLVSCLMSYLVLFLALSFVFLFFSLSFISLERSVGAGSSILFCVLSYVLSWFVLSYVLPCLVSYFLRCLLSFSLSFLSEKIIVLGTLERSICAGGGASPEVYIWSARATSPYSQISLL